MMVVVMHVAMVRLVMVERGGTAAKLKFIKPECKKRLNNDKRQPFLFGSESARKCADVKKGQWSWG